MSESELFKDHPIAAVGLSAVQADEGMDATAELQQFESAIRDYSLNRLGVDWALVERLGTALAARRCDLKVYGYLLIAVFCANSTDDDASPFVALGAGLHALGDVIEKGWERCTPRLPARRQAQLKWLSEELSIPVRDRPPRPREVPALLACAEEAERVGELCGQALGLNYPLLRELRAALAAHKPPPPPEPPPAAKAPAAAKSTPPPPAEAPLKVSANTPVTPITPVTPVTPATPAASSTAAAPALPSNPASLSREALEDSLAALVTFLAAQLRAESMADPAPYWLLRALRWAGHDALQDARTREIVANKYQTVLPLPPDHRNLMKQLPARLADGQHAEVLAECEELFATYPLWLDLQRFAAAALAALGATTARAVVVNQVLLLTARCPEVVRFRFSDRDATPFASAETLDWLQAEQRTGTGGIGPPAAGPAEVPLPDELAPAVSELQKLIGQAGSAQRRFELQLQLGEVLLAKQRSDIAVPLIDSLLAAIDTYRLTDWQPELCERALRLAVRTGRAAALGEPRRAALWGRLCQLSPSAALILGPEILSE